MRKRGPTRGAFGLGRFFTPECEGRSVTGEEAAPILVVEDEPNITGLLRGYLEAAGYAVAQAANGHDALALARRHQPMMVTNRR